MPEPDDDTVADIISQNITGETIAGAHKNPYEVPPEERVDDDSLDPDSVANPDGDDLSWVQPDEGELIDLEAMG